MTTRHGPASSGRRGPAGAGAGASGREASVSRGTPRTRRQLPTPGVSREGSVERNKTKVEENNNTLKSTPTINTADETELLQVAGEQQDGEKEREEEERQASLGSSRCSRLPTEHVDDTATTPIPPPPAAGSSSRKSSRLRVPDPPDPNSSSDEGGDRPGSADSSIAVDCPAGPTEVIVQGRNVRKIRVKFPQPQLSSQLSSSSGETSLTALPRPPSGGHWPHPPIVQGSAKIDSLLSEHLPDIHPPTSAGTGRSGAGSWKLAEQIIPEEAAGGSRDSSATSRSLHALQYDLANLSQYGSTDMDQTYKNSVISGIEYFERKNWELKELNNRILRELDRVIRVNHELEETIMKLREDNQLLHVSIDEYKIKLDLAETESTKLQEQAMSQWSSRIKAEELHAEDQRDVRAEVARMRQELAEKGEEVRRLLQEQEQMRARLKQAQGKAQTGKTNTPANIGENLELLHKISRLEGDVQKMKGDKEAAQDANKRLKVDLDNLKSKSNSQGAELETQYKRFLSLKKNFNDLLDENEKLKARMRPGAHRGSNPNLSGTWPSKPRGGNSESEDRVDGGGIRVMDFPLKASSTGKTPISAFTSSLPKAGPRKKGSPGPVVGTGPVVGRHARNPSDANSLPEALPPVPT